MPPACFPPTDMRLGVLLASTGFPRAGFPRFTGTIGRCDFLTPIPPHFVAFAWRYHDHTRSSLPLPRVYRQRAWGYLPGHPLRVSLVETTGSPTFLGSPHCAFALLFDPGGTGGIRPFRCTGTAPALTTTKARRKGTFGAQSHGVRTGCLRLAVAVTAPPRKTRFRLLAKFYRTGLTTRRAPSKGFKLTSCLLSSFPKLRGARSERI